MMQTPRQDEDIAAMLKQLTEVGDQALPLEEKAKIAQLIRSQSRDLGKGVDLFLIDEVTRLRHGLNVAVDSQQKLQLMLDQLTAPPWHPAIFVGLAPMDSHEAAMVMFGN